MSLQPARSTSEAAPRPGISTPVRKSSAAPAFKPEFVRSMRMHPVVAAAVAAMVFVLILGYALIQKPVYEAEALVYVEPTAAKVLDDGTAVLFDSNKYDSYLQQQMQTSERLDILKAAVHSLPIGVWRGRGESEQQAALRLQQGLKVERVLNSYQLSFTLKGPTAQGTADTLNAVIAAFLAAGRQDELSTAGERAQILSEEKNRIDAELTLARTEQAALSSSLGMANPGLDADNPYDAQLAGLRTQLGEARQAHDVAAAQLASVSGTDSTRTQGLTAAADELIAGDAGLSSMKATISQRRAVLSGQMAGLTPENPIYKQDQMEIADLDRTLDTMTTQMRDKAERRLQYKLRTDLARTGDVEARLNAQLASQTYAATSASPKLQRAAELTAEIQRLMKRYATVDDSLRSVQLETSGPGMAHLALAAAAPVYPVPSRRRLMLLAALPLALLCGAFAAVFFRKRDTRVYTGRDLEDVLGFTPIAVLPATGDVGGGVMEEYVLRLAGGIENAFRVAGARSFVLTPAGTTVAVETLSVPLAMKLKQLGLLVATTTARQMLALPAAGETVDMGAHEGSVVDARLDELKRQNDLVFIDSPALLTSAETEYLVRCADATILVATSGVTRRGDLLQAALLLERLGVKGVGAVLEGLQLRFADAAYRIAVADLDRRGSEDRVLHRPGHVAKPQPGVHEQPAVMEAVPGGDASVAGRELVAPVAAERVEEFAAGGAVTRVPEAEEIVRTAAVPAPFGEMMETSTQEPAPVTTPEMETPTAPAQATEEPLPMAMQFLKFEQPDVPVQREPVIAAVLPAAVMPTQADGAESVPPRAPARRVQAEPEAAARNWFQRLFQRDAEPVVSIIPNDRDEDEEEEVYRSGSVAVAQDVDIEPMEPAAATAVVTVFTKPEIVTGSVRLPVETVEPAPAPMHVAELEEEQVAPTAGQQDALGAAEQVPAPPAEPVVRPMQSAWQVIEAPKEEVVDAIEAAHEAEPAGVQAQPLTVEVPAPSVPEPVVPDMADSEPVEIEIASPVLLEAEPERAMEPAAPAEAERVETRVAPRPAQPLPVELAPEPFRTGRWEPARQTSRPEAMPWRDRRVSGPNAVYGSAERRFNWNTAAAKPIALVPHPAAEPAAPLQRFSQRSAEDQQPGARTTSQPGTHAGPARLTRQWGLLSRYQDPQSPGIVQDLARTEDLATEDLDRDGLEAGKRGYRRG